MCHGEIMVVVIGGMFADKLEDALMGYLHCQSTIVMVVETRLHANTGALAGRRRSIVAQPRERMMVVLFVTMMEVGGRRHGGGKLELRCGVETGKIPRLLEEEESKGKERKRRKEKTCQFLNFQRLIRQLLKRMNFMHLFRKLREF